MEDRLLDKMQSWFETLDRKIDAIKDNMVTTAQFENRHLAVMTSMTNLLKRVESYKDQQDSEILLIKRAIRDMEEELKQVQNQISR